MTQPDPHDRINPPPWAEADANPQESVHHWWNDRKTLAIFGLLLALLALVIFWLPTAVSPPKPAAPASQGQLNATPAAATSASLESPWSEAQLAKQRREAQDILAGLLDKQRQLEAASVTRWAEPAFAEAMATAATGDELYRERQFEQAKQRYLDADQQFADLIASKPRVFEEQLAAGQQALAQTQAEQAVDALSLALAIEPENPDAQQAFARAQVLEEVLTLVKNADQAMQLQQWEAASNNLNHAQNLDPLSPLVAERLKALGQTLEQQSFAQHMSAGFSALQQQSYSNAIAAFKRALALEPDAQDAKSALNQAQNAASEQAIDNYLHEANAAVATERWQNAVDAYEQALTVDNRLIQPRIDRIKAQARLQLDQQLEQANSDVLRLSDPVVSQSATKLLQEARAIVDPGPRLQAQINQLAKGLQLAQTPVLVRFESDNLTLVTLYRHGQLGTFEQHQVQLKPGNYVAVGTRKGYRDVRREFSVQPEQSGQVINIACQETVASR